ncbi:unnamed protein product [Leuciscus chuanchicus]
MPTCKILFFLLLALCTLCGKCDVLYQKVGGEISMDCGTLPLNSDVEWKFNDAKIFTIKGKSGQRMMGSAHIKDKARVTDGTLKVPKLETRDYGDYTCVQTGKRYTLRVVSVFATPAVVVQSSNAELRCDITGDPKAEVKWLNPSNVETTHKNQVIQLKPVTSNDNGQWTCQVKDLKISLQLTVIVLQTKAVEVAEGGKVVLPCSLPQSVSQRVVGGKWKADRLPEDFFPTLMNSGSKGLHWNGVNSTKVTFTSGQLSTNYDVTLINAQASDEGDYVCTVEFEGGAELTAKTNLTVVAKPSGGSEQEVTKVRGKKPAGGGPWSKDMLGLKLWVWIAVGASAVVLIVLVVVVVFVQRRNKRMKKRVKKLRSMRQPLTAKDYCQCNRAETEVELGQQERPLPVPRKQRNPRTHPAGPNHTFDKSREQDY